MSLLLTIIVLFVVSMLAIVCAIVKPKTHRPAMLVIGILSPALVIVSAIQALFTINEPVTMPCPPRLEGVERDIDAKRVQMFGGHRKLIYLAQIWQISYHQHLKKSAESIQGLVENRKAA